jgi:hypothetical protein
VAIYSVRLLWPKTELIGKTGLNRRYAVVVNFNGKLKLEFNGTKVTTAAGKKLQSAAIRSAKYRTSPKLRNSNIQNKKMDH